MDANITKKELINMISRWKNGMVEKSLKINRDEPDLDQPGKTGFMTEILRRSEGMMTDIRSVVLSQLSKFNPDASYPVMGDHTGVKRGIFVFDGLARLHTNQGEIFMGNNCLKFVTVPSHVDFHLYAVTQKFKTLMFYSQVCFDDPIESTFVNCPIEGVRIERLKILEPDCFEMPVFADESGDTNFFTQCNYTEFDPGLIKGGHFHKNQWDKWIVPGKKIKILLKSMDGSETIFRYLTREDEVTIIDIPPDVEHGCQSKGIGKFIYGTTNEWLADPKLRDEGRCQVYENDYEWDGELVGVK